MNRLQYVITIPRKLDTLSDVGGGSELFMANFPGPYVVIPHGIAALLPLAASLCVRYSDAPAEFETNVICQHKKSSKTIQARAAAKEDCARWII
jgi:hypothetical protein